MSIKELEEHLQSALEALNKARDEIVTFVGDAEHGKVRLKDLASGFFTIKTKYTEVDKALTEVSSNVERLNKGVLPKALHEADLDMIRVPEIGRSFSIRTNYSATMLDREAAMGWLRDTGNESLIQETVNAGTLASFCRAMILEQGQEPPPELIKVTTYDSMSINKYTPKPTKGGDE